MNYLVVLEQAADRTWSAFVPDLAGCVATADTIEELRTLIAEAVVLHVESLRQHGEATPAARAEAFVVRAV